MKQGPLLAVSAVLALVAGGVAIWSLSAPPIGSIPIYTSATFSFLAAIGALTAMRRGSRETAPAPDPQTASALSAHLFNVQEAERKSLSRELHDGVGQTITALKMELARLKPADDGDAERLERARKLTSEALQTIRNVSLLLRPTALDDLGLEAALQWHVEDFTRRTSVECRLICSLQDDAAIPEAAQSSIYRIVQEALNNIEKHANARNVVVDLRQSTEGLALSISDDGRGIEPSPSGGGLGILGMRERANMLGGSFELESKSGAGTRISIMIPLTPVALNINRGI